MMKPKSVDHVNVKDEITDCSYLISKQFSHVPIWCQQAEEIIQLITKMVIRDVLH